MALLSWHDPAASALCCAACVALALAVLLLGFPTVLFLGLLWQVRSAGCRKVQCSTGRWVPIHPILPCIQCMRECWLSKVIGCTIWAVALYGTALSVAVSLHAWMLDGGDYHGQPRVCSQVLPSSSTRCACPSGGGGLLTACACMWTRLSWL